MRTPSTRPAATRPTGRSRAGAGTNGSVARLAATIATSALRPSNAGRVASQAVHFGQFPKSTPGRFRIADQRRELGLLGFAEHVVEVTLNEAVPIGFRSWRPCLIQLTLDALAQRRAGLGETDGDRVHRPRKNLRDLAAANARDGSAVGRALGPSAPDVVRHLASAASR